jgi:LIM homeobox protein 2/9
MFAHMVRCWDGHGMLKDREAMGPTAASPCPSAEAAVCDGCGGRITDRYYLVTVDRHWHSACLKCCECKLVLDSQVSCFVKDGNIYCKEDFYRYIHKLRL